MNLPNEFNRAAEGPDNDPATVDGGGPQALDGGAAAEPPAPGEEALAAPETTQPRTRRR